MARTKTEWQRRLEFLQSADLTRIAEEINSRRLAQLNEQLASEPRLTEAERREIEAYNTAAEQRLGRYRRRRRDPTYAPRMARRRWKIRGLLLLLAQEGWPLARLPSDRQASPTRMRRTLIAMHRVIGNDHTFVVTIERLAAEMGGGRNTAQRGIGDLEDASLIDVVREKRQLRRGGQGPSQYMIAWSSLKDLALAQGLQELLFGAGGSDPVVRGRRSDASACRPVELTGREGSRAAAERSRPVELTGHEAGGCAPSHSGCAPSHSGCAPSHSGCAPSHSGCAPSHSGMALRPRAPDLPFQPQSQTKSSSPPSPPEPASADQAAEPGHDGRGRRFFDFWSEVRERLTAYGVGDARSTAALAAANGWSAEQALSLIAECERRVIDGVQAYGPGALWWQLRNGDPGSRITIQPAETYRRRQREQQLRRPAAPLAAAAETPAEIPNLAAAAAALAGLEVAEQLALADELLAGDHRAYWIRSGKSITPLVQTFIRLALAKSLSAHAAAGDAT